MVASHTQGPTVAYGFGTGSHGSNPEAGPDVDYQGSAVFDPRFQYFPGVTGVAKVPAMLNLPYMYSADCVPPAQSSIAIVNAQAVAGAGAVTKVTTSGNGMYVGMPLVPFGSAVSAANVVNVMLLGPAHTTGNTNGTTTVSSVGDTRAIAVGDWVCIADGAAAGTPTKAQVTAKTLTTLTLSTAAAATVTGAGIFLMDRTGVTLRFGVSAGAAMLWDPHSSLQRGLRLASSNIGDTTQTITITGWDSYLVPMTQTVTLNGTTAVWTTKTFKFINTVTASAALAGTLSVGTSDVFGFGLRLDNWEYSQVLWAGVWVTGSTGTLTAVATSPATALTGDVRGTVQVSTNGGGTQITGGSVSDGTRRLLISQSTPMRNLIAATPNDATAMFGVAQF